MPGDGIEPTVQMGTLEALLTDRSYDDVVAVDPRGEPVAERDGGERMVVRLGAGLTDVLATAPDSRVLDVAGPWSPTEEFWGEGDPEALVPFLRTLAALARGARTGGGHLSCWVSL